MAVATEVAEDRGSGAMSLVTTASLTVLSKRAQHDLETNLDIRAIIHTSDFNKSGHEKHTKRESQAHVRQHCNVTASLHTEVIGYSRTYYC